MVTKTQKPGGDWTVASAKARLSEVIQRAQKFPQTITRNGTRMAVVMSAEQWDRKNARRGSLATFLLDSPLRGSDLDLEREPDKGRDITL